MDKDPQRELEELIQRELDQLPELNAPPSLIPSVLSAIQARQRAPWWQRPWLEWPAPARYASVVLLLALVGCFIYASSHGSRAVEDAVSRDFGRWFAWASLAADALGTLGNALLIAIRSLQKPWLLAALGGGFMVYLACVALGTLCFQVALKNANRRSE